ncbi:unnamed protein product [Musa acuminata var. zebrina]
MDKNTKTKTHPKKNFDWMRMNPNYSTILNLEPWFFPEFVLPFDAYKIKPWIILINLLFSNIYYENDIINPTVMCPISENQNNISKTQKQNNISKNQNKKYLKN